MFTYRRRVWNVTPAMEGVPVYVDDSIVGISVSTRSPDFSPLQATSDSLQTWMEVNRVSINHTKTVVMHFCTSSLAVPPPQLSVDSHPNQVVLSTRLLGITLDDQLNWKQHVTNTISSAFYKIYMLRKLKSLGTLADELKGVYISFILPKLMYVSPAWSSSLNLTQYQLEKVKKWAISIILGLTYSDYESALITLNLQRLSVRHEKALMKIGEGLLKQSTPQTTPPWCPSPHPCYKTQEHANAFQSAEDWLLWELWSRPLYAN